MAFSHSVGTRGINAAVFGAWKMILFFGAGGGFTQESCHICPSNRALTRRVSES